MTQSQAPPETRQCSTCHQSPDLLANVKAEVLCLPCLSRRWPGVAAQARDFLHMSLGGTGDPPRYELSREAALRRMEHYEQKDHWNTEDVEAVLANIMIVERLEVLVTSLDSLATEVAGIRDILRNRGGR